MQALNDLLPKWTSEATDDLPPESPEAVVAAFEAAGQQATADVIALYGAIGGMEMMDNSLWRLWPLKEISTQQATAHGVVFSDHLISSWDYRLKPVSPEVSAVYIDHYGGHEPQLVAPSLESFLEHLKAEGESLRNAMQPATPQESTHADNRSISWKSVAVVAFGLLSLAASTFLFS